MASSSREGDGIDMTAFVDNTMAQGSSNSEDEEQQSMEEEGAVDSDNRMSCPVEATEGDDERTTTETTREWKNRPRNKIRLGRLTIKRVDDRGGPVSPAGASSEFGNTIGCIVREVCNINDAALREGENEQLRLRLLKRLHQRYKYPEDYDNLTEKGNVVNGCALRKFTKALCAWKYRLKTKFIDKEFSEVQKANPTITEEDWELFKDNLKNPKVVAASEWGKDLRKKVVGDHTLGTRGYGEGKKKKWRKEDEGYEARQEPNPWKMFKNPLEHNYVRGRCKHDKEKGGYIIGEKTRKVVEFLVIDSTPLLSISFLHSFRLVSYYMISVPKRPRYINVASAETRV
jgi:hypothetical protein